jgi:hypothetical protein
MRRLAVLAVASLVLAACAIDPNAPQVQATDYRTGSNLAKRHGVSTYSADALAEEIRKNPPANHPNNTAAIPSRSR